MQPRFAFFGHYNRGGESQIGSTRVVGLSDCGYDHKRNWQIDRNGIGILEWSPDLPRFERLTPDWLVESTRFTWRQWGTPKD